MKALPQTIAGANIHIGIIAGKLNGVMPAVARPDASNTCVPEYAVGGRPSSVNTDAVFRNLKPALNVAFCIWNCLAVFTAKGFCQFVHIAVQKVTNFIITRARRCGLTFSQATCASAAISVALAISSAANGTLAWTSPVAGL